MPVWVASKFGVKHHLGRVIRFYINEADLTPGARGAGPQKGNFAEFLLKNPTPP